MSVYTDRRLQWLEGKACACGSTDRLQVQYSPEVPSHVWKLTEKKRVALLPLLGVACWDCQYKAICARSGRVRATHGTRSMYRRGCRCQACHDAEVADKKGLL